MTTDLVEAVPQFRLPDTRLLTLPTTIGQQDAGGWLVGDGHLHESDRSDVRHPEDGQPRADRPGCDQANTGQPGPGQASADQPNSGQPNSQLRWSLLVPHRARLVRVARRRLRSLADAEDCAHEALLRAAAFPAFDAARASAFLTSTVLRLCVDQHRARQRGHRAMRRSVGASAEPSPEEAICDQAEATWLLSMVATLRGRECQVLAARAAGRSTRQAAEDLSISVKAAEGAFTRGRARLVELSRG